MKEIAETQVRYGFERIHILLRREGWSGNHKRTYRIYKEVGLNLRSKRRANKTPAYRHRRLLAYEHISARSMDFAAFDQNPVSLGLTAL